MVGTLPGVDFSDWLLSLSKIHRSFLPAFAWLVGSFVFLALNTLPPSGWPMAYLSIHLLKDVLVASEFGQLRIRLL